MATVKRVWLSKLAIIILVVPLTLHAYLGSFSRFLGDDYCSAFQANRLGILRATWYWYLTWSGRYSASLLDSIFGVLGPNIVPLVTPFVIGIWLISLGVTFNIIFSFDKNKALNASLLAASTLFLTLNFTPHVRQSLYWGQGMRSVVPPLILGTLYFGFFFALKNSIHQNKKSDFLWYLLSFLLAFGIGGFSETYSTLQLVLFGISVFVLIAIYRYPFKSFEFLFLTSGLLGSALSFITVIAAPGNAFRAAYFPPPPDLFGILDISFKSLIAYFVGLFSSLEAILGFVGIFFLCMLVGFKTPNKHLGASHLLLVLASGVLLIMACFPPAAYGLSDAPPGRTLIISIYILALLVVFSGYFLGSQLAQKKGSNPGVFYAFSYLLVFALLIVSSFTVSQKLYASRGIFIEFATAWDKTHETLLSLEGNAQNVIVPAVKDEWSGVLRMTDNPRFYVNTCVSAYYGFDSIIATDELPPTQP
jgi:hypothetical protein